MIPERWRRVEAIYHDALERDPGAREAYLTRVCLDDASLRRDVESLLDQPATGGWLDRPPLQPDGKRPAEPLVTPAGAFGLTPGTDLAHFRIESTLSAGGMGRVYLARDTLLGRSVALKVIRSDIAGDPASKRRFLQEAKAASALNHPNIVTIYETGTAAGVDFIAMEYVRGTTLEEWLRGQNRPLSEAIRYAVQIADALTAAHAAGIVHRDLKPANVMVTAQGVVKVLDFGLAKWAAPAEVGAGQGSDVGPRTTTGLIVGTAPYASPEQAEGKSVDARSDIFSFGALLYELVTGVRAFTGDTPMATLSAILRQEPQPMCEHIPALPLALEQLVEACLHKNPQERIRSMGDVRTALESIRDELASEGAASVAGPFVPAGPSPVATPVVEHLMGTTLHAVAPPRPTWVAWKRSQRLTVAAALLLGTASGAGVVYQLVFRARAPQPELRYSQITNFTDSAVAPAVSPDGRMVAFLRSDTPWFSPDQIWVKLLPNGEAVQLTHDTRPKYAVAFSPDGTQVTYSVPEGTDGWNTYAVPSLGGQSRLMLVNASGLSWIGDKRFLFSTQRGSMHMGVVTATSNRTEPRDVYWPEHHRGMAHFSYASPDNKWVLVVEMNYQPTWLPCRRVPLDGSSAGHQVGPSGQCTSAAWSKDGKWMYMGVEINGHADLWR